MSGSFFHFIDFPLLRLQLLTCQVMKKFGEKLRVLRKQRGLSVRELAQILGHASHAYLSRIETGQKKPSLEFAITIAKLFNVTVDQLVNDELELTTRINYVCE